MKIDIEKLAKLVKDADQIVFSAEGEKVLVKILEIEKQVEDAKKAAKAKLEESALKLNPNFSSIRGDKVKVYYRVFGTKYKIDESLVAKVPKELYNSKVSYYAGSKAIDAWAEEHKGLPQGVIEPERIKQLTFSLKNGEEDAEE